MVFSSCSSIKVVWPSASKASRLVPGPCSVVSNQRTAPGVMEVMEVMAIWLGFRGEVSWATCGGGDNDYDDGDGDDDDDDDDGDD